MRVGTNVTRGMARLVAPVAPALVAIVLGSCSSGPTYDVVTGTFEGGKLIALNKWVGTNRSSFGTNLDAYAKSPIRRLAPST